jgi:hypothetical protein
MKDLGEHPFCLGIQATKDRMKRMINLGQAKYIGTKVLKWFGMEESKLLMTPLDVNVQLNKE